MTMATSICTGVLEAKLELEFVDSEEKIAKRKKHI